MLECIIAMNEQLSCKHAGKSLSLELSRTKISLFNRTNDTFILHLSWLAGSDRSQEHVTPEADLQFLHLAFLLRNPELFRG